MMKTVLLALIIALAASPAFCGEIHIPGYEVIHFKADSIEQQVFFRNPEENENSFRMSIYLSDGSLIWKSKDVLNPGEVFLRIDLERELRRGIYTNALLKYECWTVDGKYRMNGAEMRVTLKVD